MKLKLPNYKGYEDSIVFFSTTYVFIV